MNVHDSERLEGQLRRTGLTAADSPEAADLILLNTCSVREKPVQKLLSRIGTLEKRSHPPTIGVCGCVAQQEGEALLARSPAVGFVLGPSQIGRVGEVVRRASDGARTVLTGFDVESDYSFESIFRKSPTRGMVTVIEGCEEYCTFCVVPYTRGKEVSRAMADILEEVRFLSEGGLKEVELLGQTINAYLCPDTGARFADLLEKVAEAPGLQRVRFITSHPRHFDDRLIRVMAANPSVSSYLHLPFQSGSNAILKRMHRRYTREHYLELVQSIRRAIPEINLSTDVIVGFPGETEDDFLLTLDLLQRIRFGQVYAFAFSPRPHTPAARYEDDVSEAEKKHRLHRTFELTDAISAQINHQLVGSTASVLIDGDSRKSEMDWQGRGEDNRVVNFPKTYGQSVGDIVQVLITGATAHSLYGEVADTPPSLNVRVSDSPGRQSP